MSSLLTTQTWKRRNRSETYDCRLVAEIATNLKRCGETLSQTRRLPTRCHENICRAVATLTNQTDKNLAQLERFSNQSSEDLADSVITNCYLPNFKSTLIHYLDFLKCICQRLLPLYRRVGSLLTNQEDFQFLIPQSVPHFRLGDVLEVLGDLHITEIIGVGGMSEIYRTHNEQEIGKSFTLKMSFHENGRRILAHEARMNQELDKRNVNSRRIPFIQFLNTSQKNPCLVFESTEESWTYGQFLHSLSLSPKTYRSTVQLIKRIMRQVASKLKKMHCVSLVHRDVKPSNMIIKRVSHNRYLTLLTDFGISGEVSQQTLQGYDMSTVSKQVVQELVCYGQTTAFASPERNRGSLPDPADDVYALGVTWIKSLLFDFSSKPISSQWAGRLNKLSVPPSHIELLSAMISPDKYRRPKDGDDLLDRIRTL